VRGSCTSKAMRASDANAKRRHDSLSSEREIFGGRPRTRITLIADHFDRGFEPPWFISQFFAVVIEITTPIVQG
jgi:hypothetical protein